MFDKKKISENENYVFHNLLKNYKVYSRKLFVSLLYYSINLSKLIRKTILEKKNNDINDCIQFFSEEVIKSFMKDPQKNPIIKKNMELLQEIKPNNIHLIGMNEVFLQCVFDIFTYCLKRLEIIRDSDNLGYNYKSILTILDSLNYGENFIVHDSCAEVYLFDVVPNKGELIEVLNKIGLNQMIR